MATRGIQVSCRVRHEACSGRSPCVNVDTSARRVVVVSASTPNTDSNSVSAVDSDTRGTAYSCFDGVYSAQSTQEEVFEAVGRPFVADLLVGYNCTIIAYGQTGSGKTYTVVGGQTPETRGLIPRAMETIFEEMARIDPTEYDVALTASFVEVYQEKLRDLLLPHSSRSLRLREDKEHDVRVEGASEITISSVAGGMAVLSRGNAQRSTGSTFMNADSSRSHSVLILTLTKKHIATGTKVRGKLFVVDLAGSEKVQKTAATGVRMEEAKHINRTSLGGNAKTHLLLTCSASIQHLDETLSTLRFGSRAKNIQNNPHVNKENAGAAAEYSELLTMLQRKIENLHSYIRQLEMTRCEAYELVRAEMQSLRMALTTMMRDHETQEHAHRALMDVTEQQLESRHRSQEQIIHQQQRELQDASATISQLEKKLELLEESARGMSTELHRLRGQQHQYREGENAETEILRRQLDASTKLSKQLQAKLSASRQEHEDRDGGASSEETACYFAKHCHSWTPVTSSNSSDASCYSG
ncbi:hypothetical protein F441_21167 [Phytophthora nicotianae CJ01A1]|uniref:Kinesin-like protein n=1 Tax=Phytophthora nicotianae CJ01A1 TaxID=1317063 RepID=W2VTS1_PHYNI|nr:hypothetical protein F441_21167 [Phytophthora nicotianae CJ01A1]